MDTSKEHMRVRQGLMAQRVNKEVGDILEVQEKQAINAVMRKISAGEILDPQFAVQSWLTLASIYRLRRTLEHREKQMDSVSVKSDENLTIG